jgi:hypothetical protein
MDQDGKLGGREGYQCNNGTSKRHFIGFELLEWQMIFIKTKSINSFPQIFVLIPGNFSCKFQISNCSVNKKGLTNFLL